ncbi:hypothetical protein GCM10011297_00730 [Bacterioplanes sanyensis]|nr:hypothetical protein GCM10011297_00730 [Bacterioplanes sanyensis]
MNPLFESIDAQEKGMNAWIGTLLTVTLAMIAFLVALPPGSQRAKLVLDAYTAGWSFTILSVVLCVIALFRPVALAQLKQYTAENIHHLLRVKDEPGYKVPWTFRGHRLGLQMRIIHRCQRGAIYAFVLALLSTVAYGYLRANGT